MPYVRKTLSVLICVAAAICVACGGSPTQPSSTTPSQDIPPIGSSTAPGPPLKKTSFMAFGDSITAGTITMFDGLLRLVVAPQSYPYKLQALLTARHPDQQIQVYNEGVQGEAAFQGIDRFPGTLSADKPQVVLLLEGVNDLDGLGADGIDPTIDNLRTMIEEAKGAGASVFVGTLLPQRRGGYRALSIDLVQPFNKALKPMVASEQATLVDFYTPFAANLSLIGPDGLHPTGLGYSQMAEIWADAIDATLSSLRPTVRQTRGSSE